MIFISLYGSFPNNKFQISKLLTHYFIKQRVIPRRVQSKYFNLVDKKLLERISIIKSRASAKKIPTVQQKHISTKIQILLRYQPCNKNPSLIVNTRDNSIRVTYYKALSDFFTNLITKCRIRPSKRKERL